MIDYYKQPHVPALNLWKSFLFHLFHTDQCSSWDEQFHVRPSDVDSALLDLFNSQPIYSGDRLVKILYIKIVYVVSQFTIFTVVTLVPVSLTAISITSWSRS